MKKILLLTDFSEASQNALRYTRFLFIDCVADFHLVCVYATEPDRFYTTKHVAQTAGTAFADQLHDIVTEIRRESLTNWHTFRSSVMPGRLLDATNELTATERYDYIVVGAKKDGTNELFGNSATTLVRQLAANVLIVPVEAHPTACQHIVLAVDVVNLKNCKLLEPVRDLAALKGATLTLLMIDTPGVKQHTTEAEAHLRQFLAPVSPQVVRMQAPGVRQGIDRYLAGHPADLLVLIPQHKGWTDTLAGNSVSRTLAFNPPVPLLTLYDDGRTDKPVRVDDLSNADCAL